MAQFRVSASISGGALQAPITDLPTPQEYSFELYDIDGDSAGRSQTGLMFRDRVATKRKLVCKFAPMEGSDLQTLLSAISAQFFYLEYPDALTGTKRVMQCYAGDKSVPVYNYNGSKYLWQGLSVDFIER